MKKIIFMALLIFNNTVFGQTTKIDIDKTTTNKMNEFKEIVKSKIPFVFLSDISKNFVESLVKVVYNNKELKLDVSMGNNMQRVEYMVN